MFKNIVTLIVVIVLSHAIAQAQTSIPQDVKDNIKERIDNGTNTGIVVGIIDASGTHFYSYGVKSLKTKEPVNEHSVFEIGSITKTFTAILLADMVVKGEVKLDDPLQKYLPAGVTAPMRNGEFIKLVHLSNHTSSLPRLPNNMKPSNPNNPYADYSEIQMYEFLSNYTLTRDIGSQFEYSNYGAGLLGHVLAAKKKMTYEALLVEVIAKPLSMADTRITLTPNMKANLAMGHSAGEEVQNWDLGPLQGAGAIRSTTVDMLNYVAANMGKIKSKLYPAIQLSHTSTRPEGSNPMVGLNWLKTPIGETEMIGHNGGTGGYSSFVGFIRGGEMGVVVLSNTNPTASIDDIGMHLLNPKSPLKVTKPREVIEEVAVSDTILESYVGKYQLAPTFILTVTKDGNQLKVQATNQPDLPVFAKSQNVFFYKVVEAQLTFNKSTEGKVESVTLRQNGQEIVGKKLLP